jgi:hypothetical protein
LALLTNAIDVCRYDEVEATYRITGLSSDEILSQVHQDFVRTELRISVKARHRLLIQGDGGRGRAVVRARRGLARYGALILDTRTLLTQMDHDVSGTNEASGI